MFKTYCGDCGNSWYIGNPRTCTCPWKDDLKPKWVGLTDDDKVLIKHDANFNQFMTAGEYADRVQQLTEARLKDLNT